MLSGSRPTAVGCDSCASGVAHPLQLLATCAVVSVAPAASCCAALHPPASRCPAAPCQPLPCTHFASHRAGIRAPKRRAWLGRLACCLPTSTPSSRPATATQRCAPCASDLALACGASRACPSGARLPCAALALARRASAGRPDWERACRHIGRQPAAPGPFGQPVCERAHPSSQQVPPLPPPSLCAPLSGARHLPLHRPPEAAALPHLPPPPAGGGEQRVGWGRRSGAWQLQEGESWGTAVQGMLGMACFAAMLDKPKS